MKKVIKLKESDLMNIIKRVIREQETTEVRHNCEVSKRNMYKRNGKFHNAFDKKKED
jgi:hypothetical protein